MKSNQDIDIEESINLDDLETYNYNGCHREDLRGCTILVILVSHVVNPLEGTKLCFIFFKMIAFSAGIIYIYTFI